MKRLVAIVLLVMLAFSAFIACAEKMEIDIEDMTPAELLALKDKIEKEYDKATAVSSSIDSKLCSDFKKTFEGMFTDAQSFSYPFFGLSTSRARTLYKVYGDCTVKYYDKSKITYSASAFYYRSESGEFDLALVMLDKDVAFKDDEILPQITRYIDKATYSIIKSYIE